MNKLRKLYIKNRGNLKSFLSIGIIGLSYFSPEYLPQLILIAIMLDKK